MADRWQTELAEAVEIAEAGGAITLQYFQAGAAVERKADRSPVTVADRECERVMREMLADRFPGDGVLGEEAGEETGFSGRHWILDPIDGTRSFVHGVPLYGVMVALVVEGRVPVGVLHFPALEETVCAARGMGCWWNDHECRVSERATLEEALIVTSGDAGMSDDPRLAARVAALRRLAGQAGTFRTWGDCYGYALVATGRAEAMLDPVVKIWDAAAVRPIIEEAGGVFTDWDGEASHTSGHVIATNQALADEVRGITADYAD